MSGKKKGAGPVGYCRPPVHSRFRKGQSGNPAGRKRQSFPAGKHDDQVDALGLVGQLLDRISAKQKPKPPEVTNQDAYRSVTDEMSDVSSSVKLF
jgi:Family of unknown function (DUF5681)